MTNFDVSIDRTSLSLSPLILHGDRQPGWCLLPDFTLPAEDVNVAWATSPSTDGGIGTHATAQPAFMAGDVLWEGDIDDPAAMRAAVVELKTALRRLTYTVTTDENGIDDAWRCYRASIARSPINWLQVRRNQPIFSLTIPCHPLPVSA